MTKVLFKRKTSDEIANLPVEDGAIIYNHETGATYLDYGNERIPTGGGMPTGDTFPIGAITSYAGDIAPVNWLICDGRAISRTTYADLFDAIGTTYGIGDGSTTFNLPNLKGRVITGLDSSQTEFDTLGETGGEKTHTLTISEMPSHQHNAEEDKTHAEGAVYAKSTQGSTTSVWGTTEGTYKYLKEIKTSNVGGGNAHNILQPYITLNYIIKAFQSSGTVANVSTVATNSDTDTYSCNYINNMDKYSTDEVKTNKVWIDGKPIYRKVYTVSQAATGNWTSIDFSTVGLSNIDYIYFANGSRKLESARYVRDYDYNQNVYLDMTQFKLQIGPTENSQQFTFVFEYTKTLD